MGNRNSNQLVVQQAIAALERMKYEAAQELGNQFSKDGYHGDMLSKDAGRIGGNITRLLVQIAEQQLSGQFYQFGCKRDGRKSKGDSPALPFLQLSPFSRCQPLSLFD